MGETVITTSLVLLLMTINKASEMVSWFFNKRGQVITHELIESMRAEEEDEEPQYAYLFQRIQAEKERRTKGVLDAIAKQKNAH